MRLRGAVKSIKPLLDREDGCSSACSKETAKGSEPSGGVKVPAMTAWQLASLLAQESKASSKGGRQKVVPTV